MRDPDRIDSVIDVLRDVWNCNPDIRLGQLIVCAAEPKEPCPEVFYMEDADLVERLRLLNNKDANAEQVGAGNPIPSQVRR